MEKAYGGVVINERGQVLLREPNGHFDGYVWTFPKGRPEKGESPGQTALREVKEETGIIAQVVAQIPGSFPGSTTDNEYFLMAPLEDTKKFGDETTAVRWVSECEAQELILKTTNITGRKRDLRLLKLAFELRQSTAAQDGGLAIPQQEQHQPVEQKESNSKYPSWRAAILEVLKVAKRPLRAAEIVAAIRERGLRKVSGETPEATIGAIIYSSVKKDGGNSPFRQTAPGEFTLKSPGEASGAPAGPKCDAGVKEDAPPVLVQVTGPAGAGAPKKGMAAEADKCLAAGLQQASRLNDFGVLLVAEELPPACAPIAKGQQKLLAIKSRMGTTIPLSYDDPLTAVFLRTLAWEVCVAGRKPLVKELVTNQVQSAREDLGFGKSTKGAPHAFIQHLRKGEKPLLSCDPTEPLEAGWKKEWRLHYLPSHRLVRMLSCNPVVEETSLALPTKGEFVGMAQFSISVRAPASPKLVVTIGNGDPASNGSSASRGLYFLREKESLYLGQSDEFQVRWKGHVKGRDVKWWVFVAPAENQGAFYLDSLYAAESLLISLWNEVCILSNQKRGKDKMPSFSSLQHAILLVEAASAALLWLVCGSKGKDLGFEPWNLPFKKCNVHGWPKCYLSPCSHTRA